MAYLPYFRQITSDFGIHLIDEIEKSFVPFEDWLKDGPAGTWSIDSDDVLNSDQQKIVTENVRLLLDRTGWEERVEAFETAINSLDEKDRVETPKKYLISFQSQTIPQIMPDDRVLKFPCDVSFRNSTISSNTHFKKLVVQGDASFRNANFNRDACFNHAEISGNLIMDHATIKGNALFRSTTDDKKIVVSNPVKIRGDASFNHLNLTGNLDLSDAEICGQFNMQDAKIEGDVQFWKARLRNDVNLERTKIEKDFLFEHVNLQSNKTAENPPKFDATGMAVEGAIAVNAHFRGDMSVFRLLSNGSASFAGSKFDRVPNFTDAKFANPFELSKMDIPSPKMPNGKFWKSDRANNNEDEAKFRKFKVMAMEVHDHERESRFLADELIAKRNQNKPSFSYLFVSWFYWLLSNFGQDYIRPLKAMFVSFLVFMAIYYSTIYCWVETTTKTTSWKQLAFALELSIRNVVPVLGGLFGALPRPADHSSSFMTTYLDLAHNGVDADWLVVIGIVQNIIGAVLLFLFLLALRNKFRLK